MENFKNKSLINKITYIYWCGVYYISMTFCFMIWFLFMISIIEMTLFIITYPSDTYGIVIRTMSMSALFSIGGLSILLRNKTCPKPY